MDSANDPAAWASDLERYLRREWDDDEVRVTEALPFGGGHSGFTFLVTMAGRRFPGRHVLRLSPPGVRIAGPADIGRQARIMRALHLAGLPVPQVLAADSAPAVAGRSFALTRLASGESVAELIERQEPRRIARASIEFLHRLREIDVSMTGIGDEPPVSLEAELARWSQLLERADRELAARARGVIRDLRASKPPEASPTLVHGDYHYANLLFSADRVVAVFDWEIAEIGDPLLDLGSLGVAALRTRYADRSPTGDVRIGVADLITLHGASIDRATWMVALNCLKYAAILAYNLRLHRTGRRYDPVYEEYTTTIERLVADGTMILTHGVSDL